MKKLLLLAVVAGLVGCTSWTATVPNGPTVEDWGGFLVSRKGSWEIEGDHYVDKNGIEHNPYKIKKAGNEDADAQLQAIEIIAGLVKAVNAANAASAVPTAVP